MREASKTSINKNERIQEVSTTLNIFKDSRILENLKPVKLDNSIIFENLDNSTFDKPQKLRKGQTRDFEKPRQPRKQSKSRIRETDNFENIAIENSRSLENKEKHGNSRNLKNL